MRTFLLFVWGAILSLDIIQAQSTPSIQGHIEDFSTGRVILLEALTRDTLDHGKIENHQFTLIPTKGEVSGQAIPAMILCVKHDGTHSVAAPVAIENAPIYITLSSDGSNRYAGSRMQEGFSNLMSFLKEEYEKMTPASSDQMKDSLNKMATEGIEAFYMESRNTNFRNLMAVLLSDFLARKFIAPQDLSEVPTLCQDTTILDTFDRLLCTVLTQNQNSWIGMKAPQIEGLNQDGEVVSLSQIIGNKPVILDFWASWCAPCIKEMPTLIDMYTDGTVEILGISIDDKKDAWLKSVERLNLPWLNILDEGKNISKTYNVTAVPAKFVIDQNGIIIAHNPEDLQSFLESRK